MTINKQTHTQTNKQPNKQTNRNKYTKLQMEKLNHYATDARAGRKTWKAVYLERNSLRICVWCNALFSLHDVRKKKH